jgi:tetratricopeptide (TPR) repeat protein
MTVILGKRNRLVNQLFARVAAFLVFSDMGDTLRPMVVPKQGMVKTGQHAGSQAAPPSCRARTCAAVVIMAMAAILTGCGPSNATSVKPEERNPHFIKGRKYKEKRDFQSAADSFKKAVRVDPDFAQAHLELALIYDDKLSDQVSAIYHYKRYLELEPNNNMSSLVRDYIDRAQITLTVRPAASGMATVQDMSQLPRESTSVLSPVTTPPPPQPVVQPPAQPQPVVATTPVPTASPQPKPQPKPQPVVQPSSTTSTRVTAAPTPPAPKPQPAPRRVTSTSTYQPKPVAHRPAPTATPAPAPKPAPPSPSTVETGTGRTHIVRQGDTLESLALHYYGTRAQWEKIYKANVDALPSKRNLQAGQRLTIP